MFHHVHLDEMRRMFKALPVFWFGLVGLSGLVGIQGVILRRAPAPTLLIPVGLGVCGYIMMRFLVFPLVDEVWIQEEELVTVHTPVSNEGAG